MYLSELAKMFFYKNDEVVLVLKLTYETEFILFGTFREKLKNYTDS